MQRKTVLILLVNFGLSNIIAANWILPYNGNYTNLENCIGEMVIKNTNKADTVLVINLSYKYSNLKMSKYSAIIQDQLELLSSRNLFFVDFYVIITSSERFANVTAYLANTQSWNPRAKFLIIFDDNPPSYSSLQVLERYYVWKVLIFESIIEYSVQITSYSYNGEPVTVGNCIGGEIQGEFPSFPSSLPKKWNDVVWKVGYNLMSHQVDIHNNSPTGYYINILNLVMNTLGAKYELVRNGLEHSGNLTHVVDMRDGGANTIRTQETDITYPFRFERVCLVVAMKKDLSMWASFADAIGGYLRILSVSSIIAITITLWTFGLCKGSTDMACYRNFWYSLLTIYKTCLLHCVERFPKVFVIRALFIVLWCSSLTILGIIQGKLLSLIFYNGVVPTVSSVGEIVQSKLKIGDFEEKDTSILSFFFNEQDYRNLDYELCLSPPLCLEKVTQEGFVTVSMESGLKNFAGSFVDEYGNPTIYALQSPSYSYPLFIIFTRRLPIFQKFNSLILDLYAYGFSDYHYRVLLESGPVVFVKPASDPKILQISDLRFCFIILFGGLFLSFICFLGELAVYRFGIFWKNYRKAVVKRKK